MNGVAVHPLRCSGVAELPKQSPEADSFPKSKSLTPSILTFVETAAAGSGGVHRALSATGLVALFLHGGYACRRKHAAAKLIFIEV
jgi:hypothetical protein